MALTKTVCILGTLQRVGDGGSPMLVGEYRISLLSCNIEMDVRVDVAGISPLRRNIWNLFRGVCVTGGITSFQTSSFYGRGLFYSI